VARRADGGPDPKDRIGARECVQMGATKSGRRFPAYWYARRRESRITPALKDGNATARCLHRRTDPCHDAQVGHSGRSTMTPQFRSGQTVRFPPGSCAARWSLGTIKSSSSFRTSVANNNIVKSALEPYGRVAKESELERA
jgi:hypothetical protein